MGIKQESVTELNLMTLWALLLVSCGPTVAQSVAVFDFELIDTSLEGAIRGTRPDEQERLARLSDQLRQRLRDSPTTVSSIGYIRAGRLRALAVTTATRSDALPAIPTVGEFLPGYEASFWYGGGVPKNTPAEIVDKLNEAINAGLAVQVETPT
jgi:hypothetical protein